MVFNETTLIITLTILFLFVWIAVLTFVVYRLMNHYNRLMGGERTKTLKDLLDALLKQEEVNGKKLGELEAKIHHLKEEGKLHFSNIGIFRYNPFSDTGGSQSFSMALLDGAGNGMVITSLFARSGNRWLVKEIDNRKGKGVELSKEEETAIRRAEKKA